jgi:hypothetical protein
MSPSAETRDNVSEFFGFILPKALEKRRDFCRQLGGTCTFQVGARRWTVDFARALVIRGSVEGAASVELEMPEADFAKLLIGQPRRSDSIRHRGDLNQLQKLAWVLRGHES